MDAIGMRRGIGTCRLACVGSERGKPRFVAVEPLLADAVIGRVPVFGLQHIDRVLA
jgi:hypothetical protein